MGRGRGKGKKLTVIPNHEDPGSDVEELIPAYKRKGRPQKGLKEEVDKEETKKVEEDDGDNSEDVLNKEANSLVAVESRKKRKRYPQVNEKAVVQEENGVGLRSSNGESIKSNGFRQNGSRRKSKPRRAAEAGVECKLLKALGAPRNAWIYWAGGEPLGGQEALLTREFPYFYNKKSLSLPGELEPFADKASFLAAIDYIVCENSDVFMASHGGNMGRSIQGHRAFAGHKKHITPSKREMVPYFQNTSLPEPKFNSIVREIHEVRWASQK